MTPVRLRQRFLEKVWGSNSLSPLYPDSKKKIGEVWFESAEELPLLLKFIFTSEKLSVQVHPGDEYAALHENSRGKTEMWYVLRAEPGASLAVGLRETISKERLREASLSGEIEQLLAWRQVAPGDTYFVPAGTVHAIGAGLVVAEIQQQSDVTYRLYDYGRPRELHLDKSVDVADLRPHPGKQVPRDCGGALLLAECEYFRTEEWTLASPRELPSPPGRMQLLMFLKGSGRIAGEAFEQGEAWMVPAGAGPSLVEPLAPAQFLRTWVP